MNMPLPPAEELALIDRELAQLDARRGYLLARRAWLLQFAAASGTAGGGLPVSQPVRTAEASGPGAQNVLLTLGAVLLAVAALAFTLVSWGSLGIGGRSAVLGVVTVAALGAPALLLRRGLRSTAESVAAVGLLLTVLDAYALHAVALPGTGGTAYAAGASAVLAAVWAAYGALLARLVVPAAGAVLAAQLPLPLAALASAEGPVGLGWALLATAALDCALAVFGGFAAGLRARAAWTGPAVWVLAAVCGAGALLCGVPGLAAAGAAAAAAEPALLVAGCAVLGVAVAWRVPAASGAALAGGLAAVAALAGPARPELAPGWPVVLCLLLALPLLGAAAVAALPGAVRRGLGGAGAAVAAGAALWGLASALAPVLSRVEVARDAWTPVVPAGVAAYGPGAAATTALLVTAAAAWWTPRLLPERSAGGAAAVRRSSAARSWPVTQFPAPLRGAAEPPSSADTAGVPGTGVSVAAAVRAVAVVCGWAGLFTAPMGKGLPVAVVLGAQLAVTAATAALALRAAAGTGEAAGAGTASATGATETTGAAGTAGFADGVGRVAAVCAAVGAVDVALAALDGRWATFAVFGALGAGCAAVAARRSAPADVRAGAAVLAVGYAAAVVAALCALAGLAVAWWSLPLLAVAAAPAAAGPRLGRVRPAAEAAGAGVGVVALAAAVREPAVLSLACALAAVVCAGAAVRPERRRLGWAAAVLGVVAAWLRLWVSGVTVTEAYTLPVTAAALAVGLLRRRRDPEASSWTAYGPGLGATLLPGLAEAWQDPYWLRPLLLGAAALAVTLVGAHRRLQAPLLLGGGVLAAVALHELAPYVVQVVGLLPRWLPPALAGLLLLAVGATYEKRLRDARRLRAALGRFR
ncbi:SCO7613 C-terminal domain-containing membrane protein [Streptomyces sp. NPDC090445]|uniref:SCO7613 C-terminal domain-containing membrane protein n=1 Tax=Streptomyces sp. NPDC090445 TaxID=3365963 RepID=UPI0037FED198